MKTRFHARLSVLALSGMALIWLLGCTGPQPPPPVPTGIPTEGVFAVTFPANGAQARHYNAVRGTMPNALIGPGEHLLIAVWPHGHTEGGKKVWWVQGLPTVRRAEFVSHFEGTFHCGVRGVPQLRREEFDVVAFVADDRLIREGQKFIGELPVAVSDCKTITVHRDRDK